MLNQASIIGRLGATPESRTLQNGRAVCSFRIATSERWKDKESGEQREKTEWHNCVAYANVAEIVNQYVNKGELVFVQGALATRKWQDKEGKDHYTTEIVVRDVRLLPNPRAGDTTAAPASRSSKKAKTEVEDFDDDIDF